VFASQWPALVTIGASSQSDPPNIYRRIACRAAMGDKTSINSAAEPTRWDIIGRSPRLLEIVSWSSRLANENQLGPRMLRDVSGVGWSGVCWRLPLSGGGGLWRAITELAFRGRHHKPLVRLPAGYSPNQIAAQILSQCSERLRMG
jgi:hypothetical protein